LANPPEILDLGQAAIDSSFRCCESAELALPPTEIGGSSVMIVGAPGDRLAFIAEIEDVAGRAERTVHRVEGVGGVLMAITDRFHFAVNARYASHAPRMAISGLLVIASLDRGVQAAERGSETAPMLIEALRRVGNFLVVAAERAVLLDRRLAMVDSGLHGANS
jgi:hypothetical protein